MAYVKHIFNKDSIDKVTIEDIQMLIKNKTEEFLYLDYEEIPKIPSYDGLAEHVSGFLNTSGGIVVFGLSERTENCRNLPYKITWCQVKKETVENNLYQRIDPWHEEITIHTITNPKNPEERIFVIFVPKSNTPPHMANKRYYIRLNFRTDAIGHDHVKRLFYQSYLQKQDLINKVYGPLFNELSEYYKFTEIGNLPINEIHKIRSENKYLLFNNDFELYEELDIFYDRIRDWNRRTAIFPSHRAKFINDYAEAYFQKKLCRQINQSAIKLEIKAVSKQETPYIDQAIINGEDPFALWKKQKPPCRTYLSYNAIGSFRLKIPKRLY